MADSQKKKKSPATRTARPRAAKPASTVERVRDLEKKLAQRTAELRASNALIEQRVNELAIINSIQEGVAAELDFQAIVDLVGDKLRKVFNTGDVAIVWRGPDYPNPPMMHGLYEYQRGKRISPPPVR